MLRVLAGFLLVSCTGMSAWSVDWLTDLNTALDKAKRENRTVCVAFTGYDWCSWCQRLKGDIFDQPSFNEYAEEHLVLLRVDFPHQQTLPANQQRANDDLRKSFGVRSFPTVYLISPEGRRQVMYGGDLLGGPSGFIKGVEQSMSLLAPKPKPQEPEAPPPAVKPASKPYEPPGPIRPVSYGALKLKSISGAKDRRIVLINNASFMVGESGKVRSEGKDVQVTCREIRDTSVVITCDGRSMELTLGAK